MYLVPAFIGRVIGAARVVLLYVHLRYGHYPSPILAFTLTRSSTTFRIVLCQCLVPILLVLLCI